MLGDNKRNMSTLSPSKHQLMSNDHDDEEQERLSHPKKKLRFSLHMRHEDDIKEQDHEDDTGEQDHEDHEDEEEMGRRRSRKAKETAQKRLERQYDDDDGYIAASDRPDPDDEDNRRSTRRKATTSRRTRFLEQDEPESSPVKNRIVENSSYGRRMRKPASYSEDAFFERIWDDVQDSSRRSKSSRSSARHQRRSVSVEHLTQSDVDSHAHEDDEMEDFDDESSFRWSRSRLRQVKKRPSMYSQHQSSRYSTRSRSETSIPPKPFRRMTRNSLQALEENTTDMDEERLISHVSSRRRHQEQMIVEQDEDDDENEAAAADEDHSNQSLPELNDGDVNGQDDLGGFEVAGKVLRSRRPDSGGKSRPLTSLRSSSRYERQLRSRKPVNYAGQLMPRNFERTLEVEADREREKAILSAKSFFSHIGSFRQSPRSGGDSSSRGRLNEDEDEGVSQLPQGRLFALFGGIQHMKGATIPVNMAEILEAEERLLMKGVDEELKSLYTARKSMFSRGSALSTQSIGKAVDFSMVAGFDDHIRSLKEMVGLPLMYPEVFEKFNITPPRGVLFHGPPGTGKTLMARALASSCSTSTRPVAFFMRKGADILSKWVGESERQLRLLFEQAKAWQPSIIFFDEIDGLAPVRSSKQDQIHSSVVSTMLALMDGLDSRGQVVVIGATNRIDSVDPALRRPGRFDREFFFGLPELDARRKIIETTTKDWIPALSEHVKDTLAEMTQGFNGADMKALCTEAALNALRRTYPAIYDTSKKLNVQIEAVSVQLPDFIAVLKKMVSSTERSSTVYGKPLPNHLRLLFQASMPHVSSFLDQIVPVMREPKIRGGSSSKASITEGLQSTIDSSIQLVNGTSSLDSTVSQERVWTHDYLRAVEPRLLICGHPGMGQDLVGSDVLSRLEASKFYIQTLDVSVLSSLVDISAESMILQSFHELKRHRPAVLFLPQFDRWWSDTFSETTRMTLGALLLRERHDPPLVLATCSSELNQLPEELVNLFSSRDERYSLPWKHIVSLDYPDETSRKSFFSLLLSDLEKLPSHFHHEVHQGPTCQDTNQSNIEAETDNTDAVPSTTEFTEEELIALFKEYDKTKRFLRSYLGSIVDDLKKAFRVFARPVDRELNPEYNPEIPMDLSTMDDKIQKDAYEIPDDFQEDVAILVANAEEYNDPMVPSQKENLTKARKLYDAAIERVQAIPAEVVQSAWTFYVFRRSETFKALMKKEQELLGDFGEVLSGTNRGRGRPKKRGCGFIRTAHRIVTSDGEDQAEEDVQENEEANQGEVVIGDEVDQAVQIGDVSQDVDTMDVPMEVTIDDAQDVVQGIIGPEGKLGQVELPEDPGNGGEHLDSPPIENRILPDPVIDDPKLPELLEAVSEIIIPANPSSVNLFIDQLVERTFGMSVHELEDVGGVLASILLKHRREADKSFVLERLIGAMDSYFN